MKIRSLSKNDISKVVETMVSGFSNDDLYKYFIPDDHERKKFLKQFMKFRLKFGEKNGEAYVTDDCNGIAIWITPYHEMAPKDLIFLGGFTALLKCRPEERKRIMDFNNYSSKIMKSCIQQPYWHLSPICVSHDFQGKGYGKALLTYGLNRIEEDSKQCFLETQSLKNKIIYEKYKFKCISSTQVEGTNINHFGMIYIPNKRL